jgi:glycine cleavage system regulatory protein
MEIEGVAELEDDGRFRIEIGLIFVVGRHALDGSTGACDAECMRDSLVLTVIGPDRTGLVEALAERISAAGGNWEASRMAHLEGQFAGILLVTVEKARTDELLAALRGMGGSGLQVSAHPAPGAGAGAGTEVFLELTGDDRVGIVRDVSRILAERGVNVEELESDVVSAPMSGEPLFTARAVLRIPATLSLAELRTSLEALGSELMVDLATAED